MMHLLYILHYVIGETLINVYCVFLQGGPKLARNLPERICEIFFGKQ